MSAQQEELEAAFVVDPQSMTVSIHPGELVIMPVDCDVDDFAEALMSIAGLEVIPLPDSRVAVKRIH